MISNVLSSLWGDISGKIFLISILITLLAYLILFGYISKFIGGKGGISFRSVDLSLTDILGLFPNILFSFLELSFAFWDVFLKFFVIPFLLALLILLRTASYLIYLSYPSQIQLVSFYMGFILYLLIIIFSNSEVNKKIIIRWIITFCRLLGAVIGSLLIFIALISPTSKGSPNGLSDIAEMILVFSLFFLPFLVYKFGSKIAEISLKTKMLNSIQQIIVTSSILGWENNIADAIKNPDEKTQITFLPAKKVMTIERNRPPEIIYFEFGENEFYLIATFSKSSLFFIPMNDVEGSAVLVANDCINSIKFHSNKKTVQ